MLDNFSDVNALEKDKNTPLHFATASGNIDSVKTLFLNLSDTTICNNEGKDSKRLAIGNDDIKRLLECGLEIFGKNGIHLDGLKLHRLVVLNEFTAIETMLLVSSFHLIRNTYALIQT